jgi:hypothetical protein
LPELLATAGKKEKLLSQSVHNLWLLELQLLLARAANRTLAHSPVHFHREVAEVGGSAVEAEPLV